MKNTEDGGDGDKSGDKEEGEIGCQDDQSGCRQAQEIFGRPGLEKTKQKGEKPDGWNIDKDEINIGKDEIG